MPSGTFPNANQFQQRSTLNEIEVQIRSLQWLKKREKGFGFQLSSFFSFLWVSHVHHCQIPHCILMSNYKYLITQYLFICFNTWSLFFFFFFFFFQFTMYCLILWWTPIRSSKKKSYDAFKGKQYSLNKKCPPKKGTGG